MATLQCTLDVKLNKLMTQYRKAIQKEFFDEQRKLEKDIGGCFEEIDEFEKATKVFLKEIAKGLCKNEYSKFIRLALKRFPALKRDKTLYKKLKQYAQHP